ncbi:hypothetical protein [Roseateles chitinivorans]|nr:hypothetical protein [Roseateles chitinivorans]
MHRRSIRWSPRLTAVLSAWGSMSAVWAADLSIATSTADIRWACEQALVARVRLTSIGLQAPDAPCVADSAGTQTGACRVVVAQALVLDSLPAIGGAPGLSLAEPGPFAQGPFRFSFRFKTRDADPPGTPPVSLVGATGLMALSESPARGDADPAKWSLGTFLPDAPATAGDLDALCKPFRHWSGLRSAAVPEQLPGDFPARREGPSALGKRIAALIGPTPPDIAAIEKSFGARMVPLEIAAPNQSRARTLAKLSGQWIRIAHDLYTDRPGPPALTLSIYLSGPQTPSRRAPWWERDPTDGESATCVTSSMVVDQLGDGWSFSRVSMPYRGSFGRSFPQYDVRFEFTPPYIASGPEDSRTLQRECVKTMYIYYWPSSGS